MTLDPASMAFALVAAHFVCDYPLQGPFLSETKARGPLRRWHLFGHSIIHGGAVLLLTGVLWLAIAETVAHYMIDALRVQGQSSFAFDQVLHMICKLLIWAVWSSYWMGWL